MMRKTLGRGLDALFDSAATAAAEPTSAAVITDPAAGSVATPPADSTMLLVACDRIEAGPFQPRRHFDAGKLLELARAIVSQGIIEPLIVRLKPAAPGTPPSYELIAGERRLRAARTAGLREVPVVVRQLDDRAALEMSLVENIAREDLNAIEEGRAFQRLNGEFNLSQEEIAARVGKSRPYVSNAIRLLELAPEVLAMVERGELSAGIARPLLTVQPAAKQIETARSIVEFKMNARDAEEVAQSGRPPRAGARKSSSILSSGLGSASPLYSGGGDPNLASLADSLRKLLKRKVRIVRKRGRQVGRIEIDFYDNPDLNVLYKLIAEAASHLMGNQPHPAPRA